MNRRELVVVLAILLAGAGLVLIAAGQPWATYGGDREPPVAVAEAMTGGQLSPAAQAFGLVGLAGVVAIPATRGRGRRLVGVLLAGAGLGVAVFSVLFEVEADVFPGADAGVPPEWTVWPLLSVAGGGLLALAGVVTAVRGHRWSAMGSTYDSPAGRADRTDDPWAALDRGEDPTT